MTKKRQGDLAEDQVRHYLERQGLIWQCSQFRCKQGEIDLIMHDRETLVFIEVRYRHDVGCGQSIETISKSKQYRIIKAAWHFLLDHQWVDKINCRFDVVGLSSNGEIDWIQNAFEVKY